MTRVLVFGTFDGLHPGHEDFLRQAQALGDEVIVCVARDAVVETLKGRKPVVAQAERIRALQVLPQVNHALPGDKQLGTYNVFAQLRPDLVAFGYDQTELLSDFTRFQQATGDETPITVLKPYQPDRYKSSLLRG